MALLGPDTDLSVSDGRADSGRSAGGRVTVSVRLADSRAALPPKVAKPLVFLPGRQPYTRWITGNASSILVMGNTSNSIHGA
jgi:hypothetical protein